MSKRRTHRYIGERWVITGTLTLETPANFGGEENDSTIDMTVLKDETDGMPFIPGTSIAGAIRSYLRELEKGYESSFLKEKERELNATLLFGGHRGDDKGEQSPLITFDAPGTPSGFELRDGVKIDSKTRTAAEKHKFDIELLCAGTTFELQFELIVSDKAWDDRQKLLNALATALDGLAKGEIFLGARKTRGYGKCAVSEWTARRYNMADPSGLLAWLASERKGDDWVPGVSAVTKSDISEALGETITLLKDNRQFAKLHAEFSINGSVMIRSGFSESDKGPDMVHSHSSGANQSDPVPIIPGTSWAGILRHRAERIVRTLTENDSDRTTEFIDSIFGPSKIEEGDKKAYASRLSVSESHIEQGHPMIQSRIRIDRFTGGVCEGALFEEQPVFGNQDSRVAVDITLKLPAEGNSEPDAEIGLLLLLLRDLWTGDLPVGGESSIGRGRLSGRYANLKLADQEWEFKQKSDGSLSVTSNPDELEHFVRAFGKRMENND